MFKDVGHMNILQKTDYIYLYISYSKLSEYVEYYYLQQKKCDKKEYYS